MALRTVFNVLEAPGGGVPAEAKVVIELVGENSRRIAGAVGASDLTVIGVYRPAVDTDGRWEVDLEPNDLITDPTGTVYKVTEVVDDKTTVTLIEVPDTNGDHWIWDITTTEPGALPSGPLAAFIDEVEATYKRILTPAETFTYNSDGSLATMVLFGVTTTYTYNSDGSLATEARNGVTRTFTYNSDGSLASVA